MWIIELKIAISHGRSDIYFFPRHFIWNNAYDGWQKTRNVCRAAEGSGKIHACKSHQARSSAQLGTSLKAEYLICFFFSSFHYRLIWSKVNNKKNTQRKIRKTYIFGNFEKRFNSIHFQHGWWSTILSPMEQPSEYFDIGLWHFIGEWNSRWLHISSWRKIFEST